MKGRIAIVLSIAVMIWLAVNASKCPGPAMNIGGMLIAGCN